MNKEPVDYKQYDRRWGSVAYNGPGENDKTIHSSGCGPTSAAMAIASIRGNGYLPTDACQWSREHGYKYKNQGTAYAYFVPQFAAFGIGCKQLLSGRLLNQPNHHIHVTAKELVNDGYYLIALMGTKSATERGTWTTGGHYILVWDWDDKVRIHDPIHATGNNKYCNGDPYTFKNEVRMYWAVDARAYNREDWTDMTDEQVRALVRDEMNKRDPVYQTVEAVPEWYRPTIQKLKDAGGIQGTDEKGEVINKSETYCQVMTTLDRMEKLD